MLGTTRGVRMRGHKKTFTRKWLRYETFSNLFSGVWNFSYKKTFVSFSFVLCFISSPRRLKFQRAISNSAHTPTHPRYFPTHPHPPKRMPHSPKRFLHLPRTYPKHFPTNPHPPKIISHPLPSTPTHPR